MLDMTFSPETEDPGLVAAVEEYRRVWMEEGAKIVSCLERLSGLTFAEPHIEAAIYEGVSQSHPLRLRASYPLDLKRATLVHELGHCLLAGRRRGPRSLVSGADRRLEIHKLLDLFLFDVWTDLFGPEFARQQVEIESQRQRVYRAAWESALALDRPARAAELRRRLGPAGRQGSGRRAT